MLLSGNKDAFEVLVITFRLVVFFACANFDVLRPVSLHQQQQHASSLSCALYVAVGGYGFPIFLCYSHSGVILNNFL